jgi:hypothetical protein
MASDIQATTCYFTRQERRAIERIAEATERHNSKIVQFAVRVFEQMFSEDPKRAMELAQRESAAN